MKEGVRGKEPLIFPCNTRYQSLVPGVAAAVSILPVVPFHGPAPLQIPRG
jgi:hypothetical protein